MYRLHNLSHPSESRTTCKLFFSPLPRHLRHITHITHTHTDAFLGGLTAARIRNTVTLQSITRRVKIITQILGLPPSEEGHPPRGCGRPRDAPSRWEYFISDHPHNTQPQNFRRLTTLSLLQCSRCSQIPPLLGQITHTHTNLIILFFIPPERRGSGTEQCRTGDLYLCGSFLSFFHHTWTHGRSARN